jgi:8-oxo-dGTP diphosphatase
MTDRQLVIAASIERNGHYLLCRRPAHKRHGLLWEFPGGKVEPGETLFAAACRELKEELALRVVKLGRVLLEVPDEASGFLICFVEVEVDGPQPRLLEHEELAWVSAEQMASYKLAPSDLIYAQFLAANSSEL